MSHQFEIAKQIVEETCPHRKLQLENIRLFANFRVPHLRVNGNLATELRLRSVHCDSTHYGYCSVFSCCLSFQVEDD